MRCEPLKRTAPFDEDACKVLTVQLFSSLAAAALTAAAFALIKHKEKNPEIFLKILSGVLATVFFFRLMSGDEPLRQVYRLGNSPVGGWAVTLISLFANWMLCSAVLLVILYPFFKVKGMSALVKYYGLFTALLCIIFISPLTKGVVGAEVYSAFSMRALLLGIELGILAAYCLIVLWQNGKLRLEKGEGKSFAFVPGMLLSTIPAYMFAAVFGKLNYGIKLMDFTLPHRFILYLSVALPLGLFFLLRKFDAQKSG